LPSKITEASYTQVAGARERCWNQGYGGWRRLYA